ncbi:TPA: hypothetical protein ACUA4C_004872 [Escherichia coli]
MVVSDLVFYSSLGAWVLYWAFILNIARKIGFLVIPLTMIFGGYIFSIQLENGTGNLSLVSLGKELYASAEWWYLPLFLFIVFSFWLINYAMDKVSGDR